MTTTHARTAHGQRIAALEADVVTMRVALETRHCTCSTGDEFEPEFICARCAALSTSTDYSGKVVVNRAFLGEVHDILEAAFQATNVGTYVSDYSAHLARLDSLRQGGGK